MITFDKQAWYFFRRWIWLRWRARSATLKHVLKAMLWLNRSAYITKRSDYSERIYALKSDLLRYLHQAGLMDEVTKQKQILTCSFCYGDGVDPYDYDFDDRYDSPCRKCGGTGIYRETILIKFCIGRYVWHQPAPLVDWLNVNLVNWDDNATFENRDERGTPEFYGAKLREHWFAVVVMYLWRHGVDTRRHQLAPLRACLKWHKPGWWYRLRKAWKQRRIAKERETVPEIPF